MKYKKRVLILLAAIALVVLLLNNYNGFHEDVVHLKRDSKEFKKKPESSIESTILHREKEVYDNLFHFNN